MIQRGNQYCPHCKKKQPVKIHSQRNSSDPEDISYEIWCEICGGLIDVD